MDVFETQKGSMVFRSFNLLLRISVIGRGKDKSLNFQSLKNINHISFILISLLYFLNKLLFLAIIHEYSVTVLHKSLVILVNLEKRFRETSPVFDSNDIDLNTIFLRTTNIISIYTFEVFKLRWREKQTAEIVNRKFSRERDFWGSR